MALATTGAGAAATGAGSSFLPQPAKTIALSKPAANHPSCFCIDQSDSVVKVGNIIGAGTEHPVFRRCCELMSMGVAIAASNLQTVTACMHPFIRQYK